MKNNAELKTKKIVCVGRNYKAHAEELGHQVPGFPTIFLKSSSDIIFSGDKVIHPDYSNNLQHEVEFLNYTLLLI